MALKGTIKTYFILTAINVLVGVITISTSIIITYVVSPEEYGHYILYLSLINLAVMIFISWPNSALLRFGREKWSTEGKIGEALASRLILFICGIAITSALCWIFRFKIASFIETKDNPFYLLILGFCLFPLSEIAIYAAQSTGRFLSTGYAPLIHRMIFLIGLMLTVIIGVPRNWRILTLITLGGWALSSAAAFLYIPKEAWKGFKPSTLMIERIINYSWAFPIGAIAAYTVNWVDSWVIRAYLGTKIVGIYAWAYQIIAIGAAGFSPIVALFSPRMIDAKLMETNDNFALHIKHGLILLIVLCVLLDMGIILVGPLMNLLGKSYQITYPVLLILIATLPIQFLGYWITPVGSAFEKFIPFFVLSTVGAAIIKTVFVLLLVPYYGIKGAALSTFIGSLFSSLSCFLLLKYRIPGLSSQKTTPFLLCFSIVPIGVISMLAGGPIIGSLLCCSVAILTSVFIRNIRIFTAKDFKLLSNQSFPSSLKRPIAVFIRWFLINKRETL